MGSGSVENTCPLKQAREKVLFVALILKAKKALAPLKKKYTKKKKKPLTMFLIPWFYITF